ncbi:NAD(P)-dependent oxidoreductase [soil metagenome]
MFVTGATGVMGCSAVSTLLAAGHEVAGLARSASTAEQVRSMGATPVPGGLFDPDGLVGAFAGCEAVCNMATHVPVGYAALRPGAWRVNDRIRAEGSRLVAEAARAAGVRRLVQESVSVLYADAGEDWIDEHSPIVTNRAAEPMVLAETHAQNFAGFGRDSVVLRLGGIVGDDEYTRWRLARARAGQPIGVGPPDAWVHVIHSDDVGTAVLAALTAPSGIYNAGAVPARRRELAQTLAGAVGRDRSSFMSRTMVRLGGERLELLTRSQRVSSTAFAQATGWKPEHRELGPAWVQGLLADAG